MPTPSDPKAKQSTPGAPAGDINHPQAGTPSGTDNEAMLDAEHQHHAGWPEEGKGPTGKRDKPRG